jgi:hypothetical protein
MANPLFLTAILRGVFARMLPSALSDYTAQPEPEKL